MLTYAMLEFSYKLLYAALLVMSCTQQVLSDLLHFSSFNSQKAHASGCVLLFLRMIQTIKLNITACKNVSEVQKYRN